MNPYIGDRQLEPDDDLVECDCCPRSGGCVGKCMKAPDTDPGEPNDYPEE